MDKIISVMGGNGTADPAEQTVFAGENKPLFDVISYDDTAQLRIEFQVFSRTVAVVFSKILGEGEFSDIVIETGDFGAQRICADGIGGIDCV